MSCNGSRSARRDTRDAHGLIPPPPARFPLMLVCVYAGSTSTQLVRASVRCARAATTSHAAAGAPLGTEAYVAGFGGFALHCPHEDTNFQVSAFVMDSDAGGASVWQGAANGVDKTAADGKV